MVLLTLHPICESPGDPVKMQILLVHGVGSESAFVTSSQMMLMDAGFWGCTQSSKDLWLDGMTL